MLRLMATGHTGYVGLHNLCGNDSGPSYQLGMGGLIQAVEPHFSIAEGECLRNVPDVQLC